MQEDRSAALYDTSEQPIVVQETTSGPRRWIAFGVCALCLVAFTTLLLVYALASLSEWLSLLIGAAIVVLFLSTLLSLSLTAGAIVMHEVEGWK